MLGLWHCTPHISLVFFLCSGVDIQLCGKQRANFWWFPQAMSEFPFFKMSLSQCICCFVGQAWHLSLFCRFVHFLSLLIIWSKLTWVMNTWKGNSRCPGRETNREEMRVWPLDRLILKLQVGLSIRAYGKDSCLMLAGRAWSRWETGLFLKVVLN